MVAPDAYADMGLKPTVLGRVPRPTHTPHALRHSGSVALKETAPRGYHHEHSPQPKDP